MDSGITIITGELLAERVPLGALSEAHRGWLAGEAEVEEALPNTTVLTADDAARTLVWVLRGELALLVEGQERARIAAGTDKAKYPLGGNSFASVVAKTKTEYLRIDAALVDLLLAWDAAAPLHTEQGVPPVIESWSADLVRSPLVRGLPGINAARLLGSLEAQNLRAGTVLAREGKPADHYYVIRQGRCALTRRRTDGTQDAKVGVLSEGGLFGLEACFRGEPNDATVTLLTDGVVLRGAREQLAVLRGLPGLRALPMADAAAFVQAGGQWLDVRQEKEDRRRVIPGSLWIPLNELDVRVHELPHGKPVVAYCQTGRQAAVAALWLGDHGVTAHALAGGIATAASLPKAFREPDGQVRAAGSKRIDDEVARMHQTLDRLHRENLTRGATPAVPAQSSKERRVEEKRAEDHMREGQFLLEAEKEAFRERARIAVEAGEAVDADAERARAEQDAANLLEQLATARQLAVDYGAKDRAAREAPKPPRPWGKYFLWVSFPIVLAASGYAVWKNRAYLHVEQRLADARSWATDAIDQGVQMAKPKPTAPPAREAEPAPALESAPEPVARAPQPGVELPVPPVTQPAPPPVPVAPAVATAPTVRAHRDALVDGTPGPWLMDIPAGSFLMGADPVFPFYDERPQRTVSVTPFAAMRYEISFAEYDRFAQATGRAFPDDGGNGRGARPVVNVTWEDAVAYAEWLSKQTGKRYRLPSEAEWEYLARGGTTTLYWFGSSVPTGGANCKNCGSIYDAKSAAPTGTFPANPFGVHETPGNVREWVADCYHPNYDKAPATSGVREGGDCRQRVVRGGSFLSPVEHLRSTKRDRMPLDFKAVDLGFRLVRDP